MAPLTPAATLPALTPAFPLLAGTAGVALAACCVVFYVVWVAPCGSDEVSQQEGPGRGGVAAWRWQRDGPVVPAYRWP